MTARTLEEIQEIAASADLCALSTAECWIEGEFGLAVVAADHPEGESGPLFCLVSMISNATAVDVARCALIAELPRLLAIAQEQRAEIARLTKLCERLEEEW